MTRIAWLTDIHLNFVQGEPLRQFLKLVLDTQPDAVLISGDIGEAHTLERYLCLLDDTWQLPVYFVLGNHDFYFGSIRQVRAQTSQLCRRRTRLSYLTAQDQPIKLTNDVALIGHDGWADTRIGDYAASTVMLNDYRLIRELSDRTKEERRLVLEALGDEAAEHIRRLLPAALHDSKSVVLLTHVPPIRGACWHESRLSDDQWSPHFACQAVGDAFLDIMRDFPDHQLQVLCGHTHGSGQARPLPNVEVLTGGAIYREPEIARVIEFD